jgi:hypothetical protein
MHCFNVCFEVVVGDFRLEMACLIMLYVNLNQNCIGLCLNTLGPFLCIHQWDYMIPLDRGSGLGQWFIVAIVWYV